jgi:SAM-dependent methyltransferase
MSSYYRQQLESYLKTLDVKAERVLDVGGSQLTLPKRVKSWDVKEYKILDLPQPHKLEQKPDIEWDMNKKIMFPFRNANTEEVKLAISRKPLISLKYLADQGFLYQRFDVVFCLEVMEYIWDPVSALKNICDFLTPGGILYITFPTFYPVHEPREQDYLRYTKQGALKLLEEAGFQAKRITPRKMMAASLGHVYSQEKMRAAKGYEGHEDIGYIIEAIKV